MAAPNCYMPESAVQEAFLASPPFISQQILDLTVKHPVWMSELWELQEWPLGNGTFFEELIFRGQMPPIERGFDKWAKQSNNSGCAPCEGPSCSYNWTQFGGHGFQRKVVELMARDFRSPAYCIQEIQTTAHYKEVFDQIVKNLWAQISFFKEFNIGQNVLTGLAKKYVVDSGGAKPNLANPYVYPTVGSTTLSALNIEMLEFFYEQMRRVPSAVPFDSVNGSPVFSLVASHQLLSRLYRDDPELRQDVRFSGLANALVERYNFISTIRGMFLPAPILYPRRFNIVGGEAVEVLPFINDVPIDVGAYTSNNPAYELATHEEVILHGKYPFKLIYMPTETSLGNGASFGPEMSFFNNWMWVNPLTPEDPYRRLGWYVTSARFGISQQYSEGIFAILVARPSVRLMASFLPEPVCPPEPVDCDNEIAETGCPAPLILSYFADPINANTYFITLSVPTSADEDDEIQFGLDTGGFVVGTVLDVSSDGLNVQVTFPNGTDLGICDHFTTLVCTPTTIPCSANVLSAVENASDATRVDLLIANGIRAYTVGNTVTLYLADGSTVSATIVTANQSTLAYTVDLGATTFASLGFGIVAICVPTATVASCPGCPTGPSCTPCDSDCGVTPLS